MGPGPRNPGTGDSEIQDPGSPENLRLGPGTPLKFKSVTSGPTSKLKSGTPGPISKFKSGTPSPFSDEFIFLGMFHRFFVYLFLYLF